MAEMLRFERYLLFPTPVYGTYMGSDADFVERALCSAMQAREREPGSVSRSNKQGWQSRNDLHKEEDYKYIVDLLQGRVRKILGEAINKDATAVINSMWFNISGPNAYNLMHNHPCASFAGVYYLKAAENSGDIMFHTPFERGDEISLYTQDFADETGAWGSYSLPPFPGRMLLFPAWLPHAVEPNLSDTERVSISFNVGLVW